MDERTNPGGSPVPDSEVGGEDAAAVLDEVAAVLETHAAQHTQELLAEHVPLALLVDLVNAAGPTSDELLTAEGLPEVPWWEPPAEHAPEA